MEISVSINVEVASLRVNVKVAVSPEINEFLLELIVIVGATVSTLMES